MQPVIHPQTGSRIRHSGERFVLGGCMDNTNGGPPMA